MMYTEMCNTNVKDDATWFIKSGSIELFFYCLFSWCLCTSLWAEAPCIQFAPSFIEHLLSGDLIPPS